jgi:signal transduction histidine kinase
LGGRIEIKLTDSDGLVVFTISDNGRGISEDSKAHVFDKFYQEDDSHNQKGNGLGLSIVKRIVELHGGTISVESNRGEGSTFTVMLPR